MNKLFNQYTDFEVIERVLKGEKSLYEIIVRRYNSYLYRVGRSYNFDHNDTQDLMQDSYVDAFKNLSSFQNRSSFKTWLVRIMLNNCSHKQQKMSFKSEITQETLNETEIPMFSSQKSDSTDSRVQQRELANLIESSLAKLPEEYRMVFSLREINAMRTHETAELLQLSESNVKARLSRAKTMLRSEINKFYSTEDLFEFNLIYCDSMVNRVLNEIENL
jgi:RNA polymerase sigma-70 factor (ECF subfamily)